eukprot:4928806-Alexandrium_andersonii.AAC.1
MGAGQGQPTPQLPPGLSAAGSAATMPPQPGAPQHQAPAASAEAGGQARQQPPAGGAASAGNAVAATLEAAPSPAQAPQVFRSVEPQGAQQTATLLDICLLYTSDAADDM